MRRFRTLIILFALAVSGLFFHYVLPQHDVVQVTQVDTRRTDFGGFNRWFYAQADSGSVELANRDNLYIIADKKKTALFGFVQRDAMEPMVYRNEDTGWIWPPYFKFDSSNLHAEAASQARREATGEGGNWAIITHYGWRIPFMSVFPNAVDIKPTDGPSPRIIPWFNIVFFGFLLFAFGMVRAMWRQFRERSVDPMLDNAGDQLDEFQAGVAEKRSGVTKWFSTWRSKRK